MNWNTHTTGIDAIVVDGKGRLFVAADQNVYVYDDPIHKWQMPSVVFLGEPEPIGPFGGAMAVDEAADAVYANFYYGYIYDPWSRADFVKQSLSVSGAPDPFIRTKDCAGGGYVIAAEISGPYLLMSCNGSPASVLVYDKDVFGRQHLVKAIGNFQSPGTIRIGP